MGVKSPLRFRRASARRASRTSLAERSPRSWDTGRIRRDQQGATEAERPPATEGVVVRDHEAPIGRYLRPRVSTQQRASLSSPGASTVTTGVASNDRLLL